jgi:hypothetical protein
VRQGSVRQVAHKASFEGEPGACQRSPLQKRPSADIFSHENLLMLACQLYHLVKFLVMSFRSRYFALFFDSNIHS